MAIRILAVDDHVLILTALRLLIENQPGMVVVGEAHNSATARSLAAAERPHVILLDLDLGTESGFDLLPELLAIVPEAHIILLTGLRDPAAHRRGIMLGAVGLVLKEKAHTTLIKAIEKVHSGEVWLERTMIANILNAKQQTTTSQEHEAEIAKITTLTQRERQVVRLISAGLKNKSVADQLVISEATVRHHLTSIFAKLGVTDRFELAIYAYRYQLAPVPK